MSLAPDWVVQRGYKTAPNLELEDELTEVHGTQQGNSAAGAL